MVLSTRVVTTLVLAFVLLFAFGLDDVWACMGPHQRTFPTCEISAPRPDERTTVVYVHSGAALSSVTPGGDDVVTEVVDVEIGPAEKPHYIVLSSGKPIIWRFTGQIDAISRVVVLGSQYNGATRSGVVGVPRDRVVFPATYTEKLRSMRHTSCDTFYSACEASAYFKIPGAARMHLAGDAPAERYGVDQFIERLSGNVIKIPQDGSAKVGESDGSKQSADGPQAPLGRQEPFGGGGYVETSQSHERGVIKIDAETVVSQEKVRDYSVLPAAAGIRQLLADGSLVSSDDARFQAAYDKWNERLSRPYRSKFDPNFLFSYNVNYLATRQITLPAGLDRTTVLVGEGVETPDINRNKYMVCFYFADLRDIQVDPRKSADPRCTAAFFSLVLSQSENSMAMNTQSLERMRRASQVDKDKCKAFEIAGDAYFAGIAVSEGVAPRPVVGVERRRIDVIVNRSGKVALYLEMSDGSADWHLLPSAQTQITDVVLGWGSTASGLSQSIQVHAVAPSSPAIGNDCYQFRPHGSYLGGPAALALDEGLQVFTGRGLDSLLRRTNDGSWPSVAGDHEAPHLTLAIE